MVTILAIESSCDETAAAVVVDGRRALSNVVASQQALHAATGGVVPEVAARQHLRAIVPVVRQALAEAERGWDDLDYIAATAGPGLPGALVVGLNAARAIAFARGLPFIPVDHIEGHVCANWLLPDEPPLPALALVVSGGHTELLLVAPEGGFRRLGATRDDAAGEAFDKVARLLGLPYPGGPPLARLAASAELSPPRQAQAALPRQAQTGRLRLPRAWLRGSDDFSFSGLKTAAQQLIAGPDAPPAAAIALAFEESVADVLATKAARAATRERVASLLLAGGVAANARLRARVRTLADVPVVIPPPELCTDNAAMIGAAAYRHLDTAVSPAAALDVTSTLARRSLFG